MLTIDARQARLSCGCGQIHHRVCVLKLAQYLIARNGLDRIQTHDHGLLKGNGLQLVDQVVQANPAVLLCIIAPLVIPGAPSELALG